MGTITTLLKIKADAKDAVAGLKPLQTQLDKTAESAESTEKSLSDLDKKHKISVDDAAVEAARKEISRLRGEMRTALHANINADTKPAQRRIRELQSAIRTIGKDEVHIPVDVDVKASSISNLTVLRTNLVGVGQVIRDNQGNPAAMASGLGQLAKGLGGVGEAGEGAAAGLSGAGGAATAAGGAFAAAAVAALALFAAEWKLAQAAADVETSVVQLGALLGDQELGASFFADLQKWAAETPFAIEDATDAAKRLLAAGVDLQEVNDNLNDMGNIASATGLPLSQIAAVFAQMESSGKASFEDIKQLADAGIPVWSTLADKMGLTVAEVQKMATEGKLSAKHIDLLRESLNELYPTAMQDQAETFNGQMSTLQDTMSQTGQALGTLFLPMMTDLLVVINGLAGYVLDVATGFAKWNQEMAETKGINLIQALTPISFIVGGLADKFREGGEAAGDAADENESASQKILADLQAQEQGVVDAKQAWSDYEAAVRDTAAAFGNIGGEVRTKISFIIDRDDLKEDIRKAIKGTKDEKGVKLPAQLVMSEKGIAGLSDARQELLSNISQFTEEGLEEGARRAALDPNFDKAAWYKKVREGTKGLLIEAGIDSKHVDEVLAGLGLEINPPVVPVVDDTGVVSQLDPLSKPITPIVQPWVPSPLLPEQLVAPLLPGAIPVPSDIFSVKPIDPASIFQVPKPGALNQTATIDTKVTGAEAATSTINTVADPRKASVAPEIHAASYNSVAGTLKHLVESRRVQIAPVLHSASYNSVAATLRHLTEDRYVTVHVNTVNTTSGGGGTGTPPGRPAGRAALAAVGPNALMATGLAAATTTMASFASTAGGGGTGTVGVTRAEPVHLAPKQAAVKVYLDGAEIADALAKSTNRVTTRAPLRRTA